MAQGQIPVSAGLGTRARGLISQAVTTATALRSGEGDAFRGPRQLLTGEGTPNASFSDLVDRGLRLGASGVDRLRDLRPASGHLADLGIRVAARAASRLPGGVSTQAALLLLGATMLAPTGEDAPEAADGSGSGTGLTTGELATPCRRAHHSPLYQSWYLACRSHQAWCRQLRFRYGRQSVS